MLIHWLKQESIDKYVGFAQSEGWIISDEEIKKTKSRFGHLCFGAYIDGEFVGGITGYLHQKTAWVGNFIVKREFRGRGIGKKLFETMLRALSCERDSIYLHADYGAVDFYKKFGFLAVGDTARLKFDLGEGGRKEKSHLREYQVQNGLSIVCNFDRKFFLENRSEFLLEDMNSKSSLLLSCENGFCHSKAVGKDIVIGAWEMLSGAYYDAERMLSTIVATRGQKSIYLDSISNNIDVVTLCQDYGFKQVGGSLIMVLGKKLDVKYDNIYAFASLGSKG